MTRAEDEQARVHFKGQSDDFIIIAESVDAVQKWKEDGGSTPLIDVVKSFSVFVTDKHGIQGVLNRASKAQLENEFGTSNSDDVVKLILEKGVVQEHKRHARQGERNPSNADGAIIG